MKLLLEIEPDFIQINRCSPLPGTILHSKMNNLKGLDIWDDFFKFKTDTINFQMFDTKLTPKEIDKLIKKAYLRFYFRPKYIIKQLKQIKSFSRLFLYAKAAFAIL